MRPLLRAEARARREERELERMLKRHRSAAGQVLAEVDDRLHGASAPTAEELPHLARALNEAIAAQRLATDGLLGLYQHRLARELAALDDEDELAAADTLH